MGLVVMSIKGYSIFPRTTKLEQFSEFSESYPSAGDKVNIF